MRLDHNKSGYIATDSEATVLADENTEKSSGVTITYDDCMRTAQSSTVEPLEFRRCDNTHVSSQRILSNVYVCA